jgi:hypothetical protein|tara:strand:- start:364 stop:528 length:165 start_codon:yes stop_codon:yes gene_type:complete
MVRMFVKIMNKQINPLDAIGNTSIVKLNKIVPGKKIVTLNCDNGLKYLGGHIYF